MTSPTVGTLRKMLMAKGWSPEVLSEQVAISNMTLRRLLEKSDEELIPERYLAALSGVLNEANGETPRASVDPVNVVLSGMSKTRAQVLSAMERDGLETANQASVMRDSQKKFSLLLVPKNLVAMLKDFKVQFPKLGRSGQALIIGGLAYFLNPFDLVADAIISIGFIDDIGIAALIHARLFGHLKSNDKPTQK